MIRSGKGTVIGIGAGMLHVRFHDGARPWVRVDPAVAERIEVGSTVDLRASTPVFAFMMAERPAAEPVAKVPPVSWPVREPVPTVERRRFIAEHLDLDRPFRAAVARRLAEAFGVGMSTAMHDLRVVRRQQREAR